MTPPSADRSKGRNDLKRQIRQLESIAALSGGIAHDYNNLLTAIMGNLSLAMEHVTPGSPLATFLEQALSASRSAKTLTRRLITFSKGGQLEKSPTDIVHLVENVAAFSLSGSNINIQIGANEGIWPAQVDFQQIGQALHNLMINAAEAMPKGGTVFIDFENVTINGGNSILSAGRYVNIAIRDQGMGIPAEHIEKIFDPYFSTKNRGASKGTGLGLSISHSIITKHGGEITVCSRTGVGSTFHVLLPADTGPQPIVPEKPQRNERYPGKPVHGKGKSWSWTMKP
ncbi:ATP-binding protein [Desulfosarcina cetonica]|uniref:ATP-binding protein n=1 Tax=Desulfosarcina cetonica TaxID=90730 RepID=UPI0006D0A69A